ncbi:hypothetical protein [Corynebacterium wankanglinii]|uniref:Peptidase S1 domain-containing protein n=1 Tax=Corynebacterium wankanglinii TaxID=2735136 RepID=A0A838CJR9_9CORY|nr:hypothetical protein [Corynebacterium wankanglinii]MBA1835288.1 hypothetical protein [Corynebacterium wankanglinii]
MPRRHLRRHLRRNPGRPRAGALAAAVAIAVSSVAVPVALPGAGAAEPLVARQGERLFVDNIGGYNLTSCTIGYNDVALHRSYTAGHCAVDSAAPRPGGSTVYVADEYGRQLPTPAGLIYPAAAFYGPANANDWSVIYWFNNVTLGQNTYGGAYIPISEISPGETLCYHGFASHGRSREAACGPFVGMIEKTIYFDAPGTPHFGDSGGPVYAPGRGFVGVMSGANALVDEDDTEVVGLERASSLQSGPTYDDARIDAFLREYYARQFPASEATPAPPAVEPSSASRGTTPTRAARPTATSSATRAPAPKPTPTSKVKPTPTTRPSATRASAPPATTTRTAARVPTGAATPSSVPSEAPADPVEVKEQRNRRIDDALVITLGVVAAAAVLVPAIGYVLGIIR